MTECVEIRRNLPNPSLLVKLHEYQYLAVNLDQDKESQAAGDSRPSFGHSSSKEEKEEDEEELSTDAYPNVKRTLHLYLYYVNGLYDEKEQYVIYDMSSFIADVGGYMGLLLGFSLQGLAEMTERGLKKLGTRKNDE